MTENFLFKAVFISLVFHTAFLWSAYLSKINDPHYKSIHQNRIEITYKQVRKRADIREYPVRPAQHLDLNNNSKLFSDGAVPVSLVKERQMLPFGMLDERKPDHMQAMELSRKISITPIKSEKINNPAYTAYCGMVHSRMSEKMLKNYDNSELGTVYLTFLLDEHGELKDVQVVAQKTNASQHLQDIAVQSLKEASPFPPFYKGMALPEYTFNVEIDYQVND